MCSVRPPRDEQVLASAGVVLGNRVVPNISTTDVGPAVPAVGDDVISRDEVGNADLARRRLSLVVDAHSALRDVDQRGGGCTPCCHHQTADAQGRNCCCHGATASQSTPHTCLLFDGR